MQGLLTLFESKNIFKKPKIIEKSFNSEDWKTILVLVSFQICKMRTLLDLVYKMAILAFTHLSQ